FIKYFSGTPDDPGAYVFANNENIPAYIFICVICSLFIGLTVSAEEIIRDRMILSRERFLNLSWLSYINSKVAVLFAISAIQTLSFVLVGNIVLEIHGLTWQYWLVLFTTSAFANMLGLNISSALNSVVNIYITIPFIIVPELLFSGVMVSFSKIHKNVADAECVPIVGDIMTSRWAYEALALEQFENNPYNRHFYLVEREISQNNYNSSFLVPALRTRIENAKRSLKLGEDNERVDKDLRIVKNMVADIVGRDGQKFARVDEICREKFTDTVADELLNFLDDFKGLSEQRQYDASNKKDLIYERLLTDLGGRENVVALQMSCQNKRLDEYLLNKNDLDKIIESKAGRLIQMKDPSYHKTRFRNGRAHFYSPIKRLGDTEIPTFWFNLAFIWLTTIFLYIALEFTWLKKVLNFLGNIKIFKSIGKK
ncbi:MAG: ABC transporter permease, partial [Bacteroidales bacterium]|nr:ABC transporter permease [Bacteroidales bacterium]